MPEVFHGFQLLNFCYLERFTAWQLVVSTLTGVYAIRNLDLILGLAAPEPLKGLVSSVHNVHGRLLTYPPSVLPFFLSRDMDYDWIGCRICHRHDGTPQVAQGYMFYHLLRAFPLCPKLLPPTQSSSGLLRRLCPRG